MDNVFKRRLGRFCWQWRCPWWRARAERLETERKGQLKQQAELIAAARSSLQTDELPLRLHINAGAMPCEEAHLWPMCSLPENFKERRTEAVPGTAVPSSPKVSAVEGLRRRDRSRGARA